ncbi:hypothetical protein O159_03690 [Leifsonia xyli subsp. cynodontis DSM 46306]|jgi:uncharacterized membrane protein YhaH (DUF805 family)|uniref:DUF805 domain-containing protein n=1 Tax=Leifsonia xyli subsp. cynodontis DSM 46306 TaxID=1389489 RepID=U3P540_LEIXC|nr:DUF805 domain-containing protein [Leifsonia xyli]AGW40584.1 hypothetical protein O159_03690 [Leifsonia xyli subsp. cynodontis DSM 46306]
MTYQTPPPPAPDASLPGGTVPLWAPLPGASLGASVRRFFQKYADFTGRASRSEYWWWFLFDVIVNVVLWGLALISGLAGSTIAEDGTAVPGPGSWMVGVLGFLWFVATVVPCLALIWRRLHDANFAGPWFFITFIPFGSIVLLVFTLLPSAPAGARFDRPRG